MEPSPSVATRSSRRVRREDVGVDAASHDRASDSDPVSGADRLAHGPGLRARGLGRDHRRGTSARLTATCPSTSSHPGRESWSPGPLITAPGGYPIPIHGRTVAQSSGTGRSDADVRSLEARGGRDQGLAPVRLPVIAFATLRALVEDAHAHELRITAHVGEARGARMALRRGADELAHMPCGEDGADRGLADARVEIVATLHVIGLVVGCPGLRENAASFVRPAARSCTGRTTA